MDKMICGHERDALLFALNAATPANKNPTTHSAANWKRVFDNYCPRQIHVDPGTRMLTRGTKRTDSEALGLASGYADAWFAIHDPAKLAEMLAARGRELGLGFWHGPNEPREPSPTDYVLYAIDGVIRLYSPLSPKTWQRQYELFQARAILLQWLQLPDGAREEAEKALRGTT
jgi:hypothetical protein